MTARKLALLGTAIAALAALAIPATASASPELKDSAGRLGFGAKVVMTSSNAKITNTALGNMTCNSMIFEVLVNENTGSYIELLKSGGAATGCLAAAQPMDATKVTLHFLETNGGDKGTMAVTLIADVGAFECHFYGEGPFTYTTGQDNASIAGITMTAEPELCMPEEGFPVFEGQFTLETLGGGAITFN